MKRHAWLIGLLFVLWATPLFAQNINTLSAQEKAQGWELLFDGKTLNGWHSSLPAAGRGQGQRNAAAPAAPAAAPAQPAQPAAPQQGSNPKPCVNAPKLTNGASHWEVVNGLLVPCGEPNGYLTSDRSFKNFVLAIEFKCAEDTNGGVFVRSPQETGGYEVQIWKAQPAGYNTGAIVGTAKTARDFKFKPDQWNHFLITAQGDHLVVVLNGETTLDVHDTRFSEGNLRLQYQKFPMEFRNIKIRPLP